MRKRILHAFLLAVILLIPISVLQSEIEVQAFPRKGAVNPEYTFTSVNGEAVSTTAQPGKTTVLVFGKTNCGNSQGVIRNIANSGWADRADIRIIFAECNQASLEAVKAFAVSYGCDAITFCYDTEFYSGITTAMWEYFDMFYGSEGGGAFPFTVFIDGNNQVRNVLTGNQSVAVLLGEIDKISGVLPNPPASISISGTEQYSYASEVLALVNQERRKKGLFDLKMDKDLLDIAMQRAAELSMYYSHTRPDGSTCFTISGRGTKKAENIAAGYTTPQAVMTGWVNSPGHYANIVDSQMVSVGIGCFADSGGTMYWVQFFDNGAPSEIPVSGSKTAERRVSIDVSYLNMQTINSQDFSCKDKNKTLDMEIIHKNKEMPSGAQKLLPESFNFTSSNPAVAKVDAYGRITVLAPGTTVVTASVKGKDSCIVTRTVTVADHKYESKIVKPTAKAEGYTLHTCLVCGDSFKDSFVPRDAEAAFSKVPGIKAKSGENSVKLSWQKVSGVKGYYIYQYSGKKWKKIGTVNSNQASYTVKGLKAAQGYRFGVKAYKIEKKKQVLSKSYASLYTATNPPAVKFQAAAGKKKVSLKWSKVKGATRYEVVYKKGGKGPYIKLKSTKSLQYTKKKLKSGETYTFAVKAVKEYKGKTYTGKFKGKKVKIK